MVDITDQDFWNTAANVVAVLAFIGPGVFWVRAKLLAEIKRLEDRIETLEGKK